MTKFKVGLAAAGLIGFSTLYAYAAGLFPDLPVVGSASYCAGSSSSATGSIIGAVTGCPNTVPAGPSIVTGSEQIPADTRLSSGQTPQTVLIPMASLNALPIVVSAANPSGAASNLLSATNLQGGIILTTRTGSGLGNISSLNVSLPPTPIDGQQFSISSNSFITTLLVSATTPASQSVANSPTSLTTVNNTTGASVMGFRWMWNAAQSTWFRLY